MNFWNTIKIKLAQSISTNQKPDNDLSYYRNILFLYILLYTLVLSPLAIIPGIVFAFDRPGLVYIIIPCVSIYLLLFIIAFIPSIPVKTRKLIFIFVLYGVSWYIFFSLDIIASGMIYLLTISIVAVLIHSSKLAYLTVIINTVIIILVGLNIDYKWMPFEPSYINNSTEWFSISFNLIFLGITIVACLAMILSKMSNFIRQLNKLNVEIKQENSKLLKTQLLLEEKNNELNNFAHTISHDLKEPLRSMQSFADLTIGKYSEKLPAEGLGFLQHINTSAIRMAALLDSLLNYAQLGSVKELSNFKPADILAELKKDLTQLIKENDVQISSNLDDITISAYVVEFKLLLQNLISNAIKFKEPDQKVTIDIKLIDTVNYWKFIVADNGIGIDSKHQEKIFTIFHRLHRSKFPGTGLGLANCKKIVEMHQGEIWVESTPDIGSKFYFTLNKKLESTK